MTWCSELAPERGLPPSIPVEFDYPGAFQAPPATLTLGDGEGRGRLAAARGRPAAR